MEIWVKMDNIWVYGIVIQDHWKFINYFNEYNITIKLYFNYRFYKMRSTTRRTE